LLRDDELCRRFCAAAKARAAESFDHKKLVPQYEAIYRGVLAV
jgi:hypothetical protein